MSETSVKIKVQHDSNIHQGVCVQNCPNQHGSHQQSKVAIITAIYNNKLGSYRSDIKLNDLMWAR